MGVNPVVVMDRAGYQTSLKNKVFKRNLSIVDFPRCIAGAHCPVQSAHDELRHFLPELAHMIFTCTVNKAKKKN